MSSNAKILIAEDNAVVRMQIEHILDQAGYDVVTAEDGHDAKEKLSDQIDLVIADVRMEPVGGFDLVRIIESTGYATPVIFVTGDDSPDLLSQAGKLGVKMLLKKPIEQERLLAMVERLLAQHQKQQANS